MKMEYLAIALLSCLVGACSMNPKAESIQEYDMPFVQGTPTKTLLQEMPDLINNLIRIMPRVPETAEIH